MANPFKVSPLANDSRASLPVQGTVQGGQPQTGDANIKVYRIKRTIWEGPNCALESFVILNGIKRMIKKQDLTTYNDCILTCDITAMILFTYKFGKHTAAWNKDAWAKITQSNIFKYQSFFKEILRWFFDTEYQTLFYYESGRLYINPEFSSLSLSMSDGYTGKISRLKAVPRIVRTTKNDKDFEGILLMIENSSYSCELTLEHLQTIKYILDSFNFQIEISTAMGVVANRENFKEIIENTK